MVQNDIKSLVPTVYYDMFCLRLLGLTHKQIAERTKYSESHIRRLFAENGALNELWKHWLIVAKENAIDDAVTMMFGNLNGVVKSLIETAHKGGFSSVAAARILFAYTLGDPEKQNRQTQDQSPVNFAEWALIQTLKMKGVEESEIQRQMTQMRNYSRSS